MVVSQIPFESAQYPPTRRMLITVLLSGVMGSGANSASYRVAVLPVRDRWVLKITIWVLHPMPSAPAGGGRPCD